MEAEKPSPTKTPAWQEELYLSKMNQLA